MKCFYCSTTSDLRPYGPRAAMVCFDCAMSTPERKAETERQFQMQIDAIKGPIVLDGTATGPYPAEHHPQAKKIIEQNGA